MVDVGASAVFAHVFAAVVHRTAKAEIRDLRRATVRKLHDDLAHTVTFGSHFQHSYQPPFRVLVANATAAASTRVHD
jgi:hypothetical protein